MRCSLLLIGLSSCSLSGPALHDCEEDRGCRQRFGVGSVCMEDGFCEVAAGFDRCEVTLPETLTGDPVVIGTLFSRETTASVEDAARLAFVQAQAAGGLDAHDLALVQCDYGPTDDGLSTEEAVIRSVEYLTDVMGAEVIIGPGTSTATQTTWELVASRDTVVISPSATSPALTFLDGDEHSDASPGRLWRTVPPDTIQGKVIASDMRQRGDLPAGLLHDTGPYGVGLEEVMASELEAGQILSRSYSASALIPDQVLELVEDSDLASFAMVASSISDVVAFVDAMGGVTSLGDRPLYFPDVGGTPDVRLAIRDNDLIDRVRGTRPAVPSGRLYEAFAIAYRAEYRGRSADDNGFTAYAYDAMWLAMYGLVWAELQGDVRSADDLARGLRHLSSGPSVDIRTFTLDTVKEAFARGESVDVSGASGDLDYDPVSEETAGAIEVWFLQEEGDDVVVVPDYVVEPSGASRPPPG